MISCWQFASPESQGPKLFTIATIDNCYPACQGCLTVQEADFPCMLQAHSQKSSNHTWGQKRVVNIIFHLYLKPYFATASSPCICSRIFTLSDPPTRPTVALGITWLIIIIFCTHALDLISSKIDLLFHEVSHFF